MSLVEKIKKTGLTETEEVTLIFEEGLDVVYYTDNYHDDVIEHTAVASSLANLVTNLPTSHTRFGKSPIIETMRDDGYLEGYEKKEIDTTLLTNIISEYWNECDWMNMSMEPYDHKRGYATLVAEVKVPYVDVINAEEWMLTGWKALVTTDLGTLEIK